VTRHGTVRTFKRSRSLDGGMSGANVLWVGERQPPARPAVEPVETVPAAVEAVARREREGGRFDAVVAPPEPGVVPRLFEHARDAWPDAACYLYGRFEATDIEGATVCSAVSSARADPVDLLERLQGATGQRPYPVADDERERLAVLDDLDVESGAFDAVADALAEDTDAPMALVGLVGDHRQRVVGLSGAGAARAPELPRGEVVCAHTLLSEGCLELPDLDTDPRGRSSAVADRLGLRSYLGRPVSVAGHPVGTVALLDARPREFSSGERAALRERAAEVASVLAERAGRTAPATERRR